MTTSQAQKIRQVEETDTVTETQSLTLVKNLIRTAISSIAYLRNIFPHDCFREKNLTGVQIHSLQAISDETKMIIAWMEHGVFEALSKKYLQEVVFGIYKPNADQPQEAGVLLESYNFFITYPNEEDESKVHVAMSHLQPSGVKRAVTPAQGKAEIKSATVSMIRTLITLTSTLKPLPNDRYLSVALLYRDDVTPPDYEPRFFRPAATEDDMVFGQKPWKIRVGNVKTPYHEMRLNVKTVTDSFGDDSLACSKNAADALSDDFEEGDAKAYNPDHMDYEPAEQHVQPAVEDMLDDTSTLLKKTKPLLSSASATVGSRPQPDLDDLARSFKQNVQVAKVVDEKDATSLDIVKYVTMFKETVAAFRKCSITLFCQQYPELSRPQIKDLMERLVSIGVVQKHGDRYKVPEDQNERDKGVLRNSKRKETAPDAARETQKPDWDAPMPNKLREKIDASELVLSQSDEGDRKRRKKSVIREPLYQR